MFQVKFSLLWCRMMGLWGKIAQLPCNLNKEFIIKRMTSFNMLRINEFSLTELIRKHYISSYFVVANCLTGILDQKYYTTSAKATWFYYLWPIGLMGEKTLYDFQYNDTVHSHMVCLESTKKKLGYTLPVRKSLQRSPVDLLVWSRL